MTDARSSQPAPVTEAALDLVVPLLKASLEPASQRATRPIDSPAGQIISQILRRDMDTGGMDGTINLAASLAFTLSYLLPVLAQTHGREPEEIAQGLADQLRKRSDDQAMARVVEKILSPEVTTVLVDIYDEDQVGFFNVLLSLADCTAIHAQAVAHALKTPLDEVWADIDTGLRE